MLKVLNCIEYHFLASHVLDVPKYAYVKIPPINEAARKMKTQAQTLRIKNKIKFLLKKKQQLHLQLYQAHIHDTNIW
jgi:hypothetical protein